MVGSVTSTGVQGLRSAARVQQQIAHQVANPARSLHQPEQLAVQRSTSLVTYQASAAAVRTADELVGSLLNTFA